MRLMLPERIVFWSNAGSGTVDGHQLTALQPIVWAFEIFLESHVPNSTLHVKIEIEPSELPHANINP